jgi:hypothetical protein
MAVIHQARSILLTLAPARERFGSGSGRDRPGPATVHVHAGPPSAAFGSAGDRVTVHRVVEVAHAGVAVREKLLTWKV